MKTISMLEFRKRSGKVLKQISKGQAFVLTYRGQPIARLEPISRPTISADDPIYSLDQLATDGAGPLTNAEIDNAVYGK